MMVATVLDHSHPRVDVQVGEHRRRETYMATPSPEQLLCRFENRDPC